MLLFCLTIAFSLLCYHSMQSRCIPLSRTVKNRGISHAGEMHPHFQNLRKRGMELAKDLGEASGQCEKGIKETTGGLKDQYGLTAPVGIDGSGQYNLVDGKVLKSAMKKQSNSPPKQLTWDIESIEILRA
ncbi:hypothetical protein, variant [Puccinia graminis f. sp. tritici CRL 75-36-700-3]|uniref:Uncharacterized protein n=1 Tax=Puccinia graminis f. sp. tritici (strain CRL 75-36-700-3 / race SCCL) TaxID=418459 RepID=H6QTR1_PUCGT|nr:hypothetical protein, variant [Puccinia graminis f. sp. tritici CRL 75-36-700-3]EHS64275.1 hypothetical protein, variant [Puccinia graminis f. sp. tritici CRL 75-36-700-3]